MDNNQNTNLLIAIVLSVCIIGFWHYFVERPKLAAQTSQHKQYKKAMKKVKKYNPAKIKLFSREESLNKDKNKRIHFENEYISGSINPRGLKIDDLVFKKYRQTTDPNSENVKLLSPQESYSAYFTEFGWYSKDTRLTLPGRDTIWNCNADSIGVNKTVSCSWSNSDGLKFVTNISLDDKYMFDVNAKVANYGDYTFELQHYGIIYKIYEFNQKRMSIVHEGVSGVFDEELKEFSYKEIKDKKTISNSFSSIDWLGITDKYWLVAFVPDNNFNYTSNNKFLIKDSLERYQIDFISEKNIIEPNSSLEVKHNLFGGAKELDILDFYEESMGIKLFDRTVDFGWFYIITKPLLNILHFFYGIFGNFGISIMFVTVLVKLAMFSLANKSYKSMKMMKQLQPKIEHLKEKYADDKVRFNQEVMNLYKTHNVNPLSGCLPIFVQIPVFFSLYKVLNVSIDMRHAPFFGWINDLSAPDPSNIFTLFGLLPIDPPSFLHIGAWPLLMCATMYLQQRMSPPMSDPVQAQFMKLMPLIFLFMFNNFPAGLLIYWTWNNILSIAQQSYINYSNDKE